MAFIIVSKVFMTQRLISSIYERPKEPLFFGVGKALICLKPLELY